MGELLLCSQELASVPYYIENMAWNVYSLEELCHYLKHNIDLVELSFMDKELIGWIQAELKMPALSRRLMKILEEEKGLSEFALTLAGSCNYCTREELEEMKSRLAAFENKSEIECRKIRTDRLLEKKRYGACILKYQKLLEEPEAEGELEGNIYHNLGTAYAGLFFFKDAADCYGKAYEKNRNPVSYQQRQEALLLAEGFWPKEEAISVGSLKKPEEALEQWKEAYRKGKR